jgi:hypothetical protein
MSAVLLLTTPALLWGLLLLASAALKDPGLGGLGASTLLPLGVASTVGLAGATGVALASRFAAPADEPSAPLFGIDHSNH